jgi:myo-inositol 2-dehydrogenase/D-chiro-inositol 1-dehydrogenase
LYKKIKDHELAVVTMNSRKGVICVITNSRHCSFGYDQRVELFGKKGMLLSGNKKIDSTELFNSNASSTQKPFLNFFIERYNEAYNLQLKELVSLHQNKIRSRSTFEDGYMALKLANACYKSIRLKKTIKL